MLGSLAGSQVERLLPLYREPPRSPGTTSGLGRRWRAGSGRPFRAGHALTPDFVPCRAAGPRTGHHRSDSDDLDHGEDREQGRSRPPAARRSALDPGTDH